MPSTITESAMNEMDRYRRLLRLKHETTVTGGDCDDYTPVASRRTHDVLVYCADCGVVLDKRVREDGERP
jgi:hypothetical protein